MLQAVQRGSWNKVTAGFWALWEILAEFQVSAIPCEQVNLSGSVENIFGLLFSLFFM